ncbi:MAG: hypothetical protein ACI9ES_001188 [Oceanospirillaceae bacterium]|jgi:hypothetical protein
MLLNKYFSIIGNNVNFLALFVSKNKRNISLNKHSNYRANIYNIVEYNSIAILLTTLSNARKQEDRAIRGHFIMLLL